MDEPISIPDAREKLKIIAMKLNVTDISREEAAEEIANIAARMVRRKPKFPVAKARRGSLTPELAERIRKYKQQNPTLSNRVIGEAFGVDGGRVSEAIHKAKGF